MYTLRSTAACCYCLSCVRAKCEPHTVWNLALKKNNINEHLFVTHAALLIHVIAREFLVGSISSSLPHDKCRWLSGRKKNKLIKIVRRTAMQSESISRSVAVAATPKCARKWLSHFSQSHTLVLYIAHKWNSLFSFLLPPPRHCCRRQCSQFNWQIIAFFFCVSTFDTTTATTLDKRTWFLSSSFVLEIVQANGKCKLLIEQPWWFVINANISIKNKHNHTQALNEAIHPVALYQAMVST